MPPRSPSSYTHLPSRYPLAGWVPPELMGLESLTTLRLYRNFNLSGQCKERARCNTFTAVDGRLFGRDESFVPKKALFPPPPAPYFLLRVKSGCSCSSPASTIALN